MKLNYKVFCALPDDGKRYEILDGDLFMSPSPTSTHQRVLFRLGKLLSNYVDGRDLGEVFIAPLDVLLGENDIVEPDLIYVSNDRRGIVTEKHIRGVPDLLIEIVSLSKPEYDTHAKRAVYARSAVPWYWIVQPEERSILELELQGSSYKTAAEWRRDESFRPRLFPELTIPLGRIWA